MLIDLHLSLMLLAYVLTNLPCCRFHVLSDFDEGKRSCRRKLERHNDRRRRKSSDSKGSGPQLADHNEGYDEAGKGDNNSLR